MKLILIAALVLVMTGCERQATLPVYYAVPDFSLTERSNREITLNDLKGHVWIADFMFTGCAGMCLLMGDRMSDLQDTLPDAVRLVSFTVDPDRDTPEVLAEYAARYGADSERWLFLTGPKDALYELSIEGFKLGLDDSIGTEAEPITHSTRFVLVDRDGQIRGYYGVSETAEMDRLLEDVKRLL